MPQQILLFCENGPMTSEHLLQHCPLHDDRQAAFVDTIHVLNESTYRSVAVHRKVYGFKCDGDRRHRIKMNVKTTYTMDNVVVMNGAEKDYKVLPKDIQAKFDAWAELVKFEGIRRSRTRQGYHDECLNGFKNKKTSPRSTRLSDSHRVVLKIHAKWAPI